MKFHKANDGEAGSTAKMELISRRSSNARISTFKRSRSFRASAKFMSKIRSHATNARETEIDFTSNFISQTSARSADNADDHRDTENCPTNLDYPRAMSQCSQQSTKEIDDLRGIVRDVKNKLSFSVDRTKRVTATASSRKIKQRDNKIYTKNNAKNLTNELHSYENPTFSLDGSFDSSLSECLYKHDPHDAEGCRDNIKNTESRKNEKNKASVVTILVGEPSQSATRHKSTMEIINEEKSDIPDSLDFCCQASGIATKDSDDSSNFSRINRGARFRFGVTTGSRKKIAEKVKAGGSFGTGGKSIIGRTGNSGLSAIAATAGSSMFISLQTFRSNSLLI